MKDILKFGRFVARIVEAHNQDDTEREKQLATQAEQFFDLYEIPDYDSETGRPVEETPFDETFFSEVRTDIDGATKGEAYLQKLIQDTRDLKDKAEAYLQQTEGKKAPGRAYMVRCADTAEGTLEYLEQLAGQHETAQPAQPNSTRPTQGRESLYKRKVTVRANEFANVISQLIENGILLRTSNDSDKKLQALFKSFLIGAGDNDVIMFGRGDRMTVNNTNRFAHFLNRLHDKITEKDSSITKGKLWKLVQDWFQDIHGNPYKEKSLNVSGTRGREQYSDDKTLDEIAIKLAQILTQ